MIRPRPGRFRRLILRPLLWGLVGVALLALLAQRLVDTERVRRLLRTQIETRLSERLGRAVTVRAVTVRLIPFELVVRGFEIGSPRGVPARYTGTGDDDGFQDDMPVLLRVPRIVIEVDLGSLRGGVLRLERLVAERPEMEIALAADGSHNLLSLPQRPASKASDFPRFDIFIAQLEVIDGHFFFDQRKVQLSFAAHDIAASLEGRGEMHLYGEVRGKELIVRLPKAQSQAMIFHGGLTLRRTGLTIEHARAIGSETEVDLSGTCDWRDAPRVGSQQGLAADRGVADGGGVDRIGGRRNKRCVIRARGRTSGDQLAQLGYFRDLEGDVRFDGTFEWRPGSLGWRSRIEAPALALWGRRLRDVRGVLAADRQGIRFDIERAVYAGGSLRGAVTYDRRQEGEPVAVDLSFEELAMDTVLRDQGIPVAGVASRLAGRMRYRFPRRAPKRGDGRGELSFRAEFAGGERGVEDSGPGDPGRGDREIGQAPIGLALAGRAPIRIENGLVSSVAISASGEGQSLVASGTYALETQTGQLDYEVTTADLARLVEVLPFIDPAGPAAAAGIWPTAGRGVLRGVLRLRPGSVAGDTTTSDLRVDLVNVEAPALYRSQPIRGSLRAGSSGVEDLRLEIGGAEAAMLVRGSIPYGQDPTSGLSLSIDVVDWPLDAARAWVPFTLPLDGLVTGRIAFSVTDGVSRGRIDAEARPAVLEVKPPPERAAGQDGRRSVSVDAVRARLAWDSDAIEIEHLGVAAPAGLLAGSGAIQRAEDGALALLFEGPAIRLDAAPLDRLTRGRLAGLAAAELRLGGTLRRPTFDLTVSVPSLRLGPSGERLLGAPSRLRVAGDAEELTVSLDLADRIRLVGGGRLAEALTFDLDGEDLGAFAPLASASFASASFDSASFDSAKAEDVDGQVSGHVRIVSLGQPTAGSEIGTLDAWSDWLARTVTEVDLDTLRLTVAGRTLENREPIRLRATGDGIEVLAASLVDPASSTHLTMTGDLARAFAGHATARGFPGELDLQVTGSFDTRALPALWPGFESTGRLDFTGQVGGRIDAPRIELAGTIVEVQALLPDAQYSLHQMRGTLRFAADAWNVGRLALEDVEADFASGVVRASGWVDLRPGWVDLRKGWVDLRQGQVSPASGSRPLAGGSLTVPGLDLRVAARDLVLHAPAGWRLAGGADFTVIRDDTAKGVRVRGRAQLAEARFEQDLPVGFAEVLAGAMARQRVRVVQTGSWLDAIGLDVAIELPSGLEVDNNLADLSGSADLILRGSLARPQLLGTVDFAPGGRLRYGNTEYEIDRGRLTFADPLRIDPEVDLVATTRVREYDVGLALSGTIDRLDVGFSSDPPLPDLEVFRLLATGETEGLRQHAATKLPGAEERSTSAAGLLYGQAASVVGDRVGSLFGLDTFRVAPLTSSGDALSRTRITVGKRLSRDLFVTYSTDPSSTEDQRLQVEWQVGRNFVLVLTQNGDDSYAADARWEKSY